MATIFVWNRKKILRQEEEVLAYLKEHGLIYEFWGTERINDHMKKSFAASPEDQQKIFDLYASEISDLKARQGYRTQDMVALSEATPNLDAVLDKLRKEHHHTDDEVRFVAGGSGIFRIRQNDLVFDVIIQAGDLLVVPAFTRHRFDLTAECRIKCIRIFKDAAGWLAIYDEPKAALEPSKE